MSGGGVSVDGPASRSLHVDGWFPVFPQEDAIWSDTPAGGGLAQLSIPVSMWEGRDHNPSVLIGGQGSQSEYINRIRRQEG